MGSTTTYERKHCFYCGCYPEVVHAMDVAKGSTVSEQQHATHNTLVVRCDCIAVSEIWKGVSPAELDKKRQDLIRDHLQRTRELANERGHGE